MSQPASLTPASAVHAARSLDSDTFIGAREFAEGLGYDAFLTKATIPAEFAGVPMLTEGFDEGFANARCEHEQVRAGML